MEFFILHLMNIAIMINITLFLILSYAFVMLNYIDMKTIIDNKIIKIASTQYNPLRTNIYVMLMMFVYFISLDYIFIYIITSLSLSFLYNYLKLNTVLKQLTI